jgi:uncharacterized membrane protein
MIRGDRHDRLDALRGFAMVWMALFHFVFDLNFYGLVDPRQDFYRDPLWTTQRTLIVSLFLLAAGAGQAVAVERGQPWPRFWKRWAQVAGCAVLVSAGSYLMFPRSWISFGVLHGIALMLLVLRATAPLGRAWFLIGLVALVLPHVVQHPFFDTRWTNWVGLVTRKPVTEDFVPLLPWIGVMGIGYASARELLRAHPGVLAGRLPRVLRPLAALGRWPLTFYMLHQPVLIGGILAWLALTR